jgi:hypothetical protein
MHFAHIIQLKITGLLCLIVHTKKKNVACRQVAASRYYEFNIIYMSLINHNLTKL